MVLWVLKIYCLIWISERVQNWIILNFSIKTNSTTHLVRICDNPVRLFVWPHFRLRKMDIRFCARGGHRQTWFDYTIMKIECFSRRMNLRTTEIVFKFGNLLWILSWRFNGVSRWINLKRDWDSIIYFGNIIYMDFRIYAEVIGFFPEITPNCMQPNMRREIEYMCGLANKIHFNSICDLKKKEEKKE